MKNIGKVLIMKELLGTEAITAAMTEEMLRDEKVFLMGEDVGIHGGPFGACNGMLQQFGPNRVRNTPISEAAIVGGGMGAAITGMRPIVEIMFSDFTTCAMDQIVNQVAKVRYMFGGKVSVPLTIRTSIGGYVQNAAQHSQSMEAWFMHVPGLKVVIPSDPYDAKGLLKSAIRDDNPVMLFEHKALYTMKMAVPDEEYLIPLGKASIKREGSDVTVVATSLMVQKAMAVAKELQKSGISLEIIDPMTLMPLDEDTILTSVKKTGKAIIMHEAMKICGAGAEIASIIQREVFDYLDAPVERIGAKHTPIPYAHVLEQACLPQEQDLIEAVHFVMNY